MVSGLQRRSSTFGKKPTGSKQDPRPISDKGYQQNCARLLIQYLSTHSYEHPVSLKTLASPMSKDVFNIMQFLLRQVDPHIKAFGKIEDDVPTLFKQLKYPFQISKSALFAVGSPHTWPSLLAALGWLVELLNYSEKAEQARPDAFDDKQRSETDFFEYVARSYRFFLAGEDYQSQAVDDEKAQELEERAGEVKLRNQAIQQENEGLQAELDAMRRAPSAVAAARSKKAEHASDRQKFVQLNENLQSHKVTLQRKLQERQGDLQSKQQLLAAVEKDNSEMRVTVGQQTVNKDDVVRMNQEKTKQTEILSHASSQREALEGRVYEQEVALEHRFDELEAAVQAYYTSAERLQLIPSTAKRTAGVQYELQVNRGGATATEIVSVDFKGTVKPALGRLRDNLATRARELSQELLALQEKRDAGLDALTERTEDNAALETMVHRLEATLRGKRKALEVEVHATEAQAERLKGEVAALRSVACDTLAESEARMQELQAHCDSAVRSSEAEMQELHVNMSSALEVLFHHKLHIQQALDKVQQHVEGIKAELIAL
eukprot:jgi/Astpho2/3608/e_gw1.00058.8.1_t